MRESTMNQVAEELERYKVTISASGYVIYDTKLRQPVRDSSGFLLTFRNKGLAERKIEALKKGGE